MTLVLQEYNFIYFFEHFNLFLFAILLMKMFSVLCYQPVFLGTHVAPAKPKSDRGRDRQTDGLTTDKVISIW